VRRVAVSAALLIAGAAMLAGARLADASPPSSGIFRIGKLGTSWPIDPQLGWLGTDVEYATAATLYNYPDKRPPVGARLAPEVASSFAVSRDGKTYTFRIRRGFRFSDGSPVTAKSFAYAIDRC
jgi:peptide/nickel transport system substrate-binding protein